MNFSQWRSVPRSSALPSSPHAFLPVSPSHRLQNVEQRSGSSSKDDLETEPFPLPQMQGLRLLVITQFYPPDFAATGQLVEELVHHLGHHNVSVEVFTGQPGYAFQTPSAPTQETQEKVTVRRSQIARLWPRRIRGKAINGILFCLRAAFHVLRRGRHHDVVLLTTAPPFLPMLGWLAHVLFNLPYVCLIYDLYPDVANQLGVIAPDHWLARAWNWMNVQLWRRANGVVVLSSTMRDRVVAKCPAIASKVSVIHNWADPSRIVPLEKHRNWFAWKHDLVERFTVLYSGNLGRCHDVETLLSAAQCLEHEPIQFVVVGGGVKYHLLEAQAQALNLKHVYFLPYQDRQDLPFSLTACDLALVSVEVGMEGLVAPSKLYSALASGRPIAAICEPGSYLRSLIREAGCGQSFRNGDAEGLANFIRRLREDPTLARTMGEAGRAYLQAHFTPALIARQYAQVLTQAANPSSIPLYPMASVVHPLPLQSKRSNG